MGYLDGHVAIITGSGQGIGRAVAIRFAQEGCKVITNNRKPGSGSFGVITPEDYEKLSPEKKEWFQKEVEKATGDAKTTADYIKALGGQAEPFFADISNFEEARKLVEFAVETYGKVDIVVNVAGSFGFCAIDEISEELWDKVNNAKPKGHFNVIRHAVPYMKKNGWGRIINCTSRAFMGDVFTHAEYCAANGGVVGLTRAVAVELADFGITCNAFSPFAASRASYEMDARREVGNIVIGNRPAPTMATTPPPSKLTPFLVYLCTDAAADVNGAVFSIGGNNIAIHDFPLPTHSMYKAGEEDWSVEEILRDAPRRLLNGYQNITKLI